MKDVIATNNLVLVIALMLTMAAMVLGTIHYTYKTQESKRALIFHMSNQETPCEQMIKFIKEEL